MQSEGPRYKHAAEITATIINCHSDPTKPLWMRYRNILYLIADDRTFALPVGYSDRLHARLQEEISSED